MAFAPVITRLYGPEAFGMLGTFMAILGVLTPITALTYPIAIVLPKSDADAKSLAKLSAILALVIAAITAVVLLVWGGWIAEALSLGAIAGLLLLIPLAMLFSAFQQILTQWLIRKKQFKITARVAVIQALTINSAKAGVGWFHPVGAVLIVIATIGHALHAAMLWSGIRGRETAQPSQDESTGTIRELARRHRDFPMYRAPQVMISAMSLNIPVLMLASLAGPAAAGLYTLSKSILGIPATLISKSVSDVFYPKVAEAINAGRPITSMLVKATFGLSSIGIVPLLIIAMYGPILFSFVFGGQWEEAGYYARWLAIFMFFNFINTPVVAAIPVLKMQRWFLVYGMFSAVMRAVGLFVGYMITSNPIYAIAYFSIFGSLAYGYLIIVTILKSRSVPGPRC